MFSHVPWIGLEFMILQPQPPTGRITCVMKNRIEPHLLNTLLLATQDKLQTLLSNLHTILLSYCS